MSDKATLYMVASPIGNLGDITYRAVSVLKECDVIACEDTRKSAKLLARYRIEKRLVSCRAANEKESSRGIIKLLSRGDSVGYLTDAGTPGISDPGALLATTVRRAGFPVVPLPGASALTTLLSVAGGSGTGFLFGGFLPQRGEKRKKRLNELLSTNYPLLIYETPHRFIHLLEELNEAAPEREIVAGREMTKIFEEFTEGFADNLLDLFRGNVKIRGELAVFIRGGRNRKPER